MTEMWAAVLMNWNLLVIVLIGSALVGFAELSLPAYRARVRYRIRALISFFATLSFAMLGMTIGYLAGLSRQPTIGTVLPAVLSLVAAVGVLMIGQKLYSQLIIGKVIFVLSLMLLLGTTIGAQRREALITAQRHVRLQTMYDLEFQKDIAVREARIRAYRSQFNLPSQPVDVTAGPQSTEKE